MIPEFAGSATLVISDARHASTGRHKDPGGDRDEVDILIPRDGDAQIAQAGEKLRSTLLFHDQPRPVAAPKLVWLLRKGVLLDNLRTATFA